MQDCPDLGILELLIDFRRSETYIFMAEIMDPVLIGGTVEDV